MKLSLFIAILFACTTSVAQSKKIVSTQIDSIRVAHELPILKRSASLNRSSTWYAFRMRTIKGLKHSKSWFWFKNHGEAEAIAKGYHPVEAWMKSPGHRSIILGRGFKRIGVGRSGNYYVIRVKQ